MNPAPVLTALARPALVAFLLILPAAGTSTFARPPSYREARPVVNGCHISTLVFTARYRTEFPDERCEAARIELRDHGGVGINHSIALMTWRGEWWCRDDLLGVARLGVSVTAGEDVVQLANRAERILDRVEERLARSRRLRGAPFGDNPSIPARLREISAAAALLGSPSRIFWVQAGGREIPVLLYRPAAGEIAVYEPTLGSCLGTIDERNDARVVRLVAERLGYVVAEVRPDTRTALLPAAVARLQQ
jgi:hypothetical protein